MANVKVQLRDGLLIGKTLQYEIELREATAGDVLGASQESERLMQAPDKSWQLVSSPGEVVLNILRRRIVRAGTFEGPFTPEILYRLSAVDFQVLQVGADTLDRASEEAAMRRVGEPGAEPPGT